MYDDVKKQIGKYCTTPTQSRELMDVGLSETTADMHYMRLIRNERGEEIEDPEWSLPRFGSPVSNNAQYAGVMLMKYEKLPCWTIGALLELLKIDFKIEKTPLDQTTLFTHGIEFNDYVNDDVFRTYENEYLIDSVIEAVMRYIELYHD